jgi:hypothetical protein
VLLLVLGIAVLVLVLEETWYSKPAHWSASSRERLRSTVGIAAVQTAIEYEYRFTEYPFAEYDYDEIRCEARTTIVTQSRQVTSLKVKAPDPRLGCTILFVAIGRRYRLDIQVHTK